MLGNSNLIKGRDLINEKNDRWERYENARTADCKYIYK